MSVMPMSSGRDRVSVPPEAPQESQPPRRKSMRHVPVLQPRVWAAKDTTKPDRRFAVGSNMPVQRTFRYSASENHSHEVKLMMGLRRRYVSDVDYEASYKDSCGASSYTSSYIIGRSMCSSPKSTFWTKLGLALPCRRWW